MKNQHKYYNKKDETARYNDLYMGFSGKFIFIRYNPDPYKENGKKKNPQFDTRMKRLEEEMKIQEQRILDEKNNGFVERVYLYYDC